MDIYERICKLCSVNQTTITNLFLELCPNKSKGNMATWRKGHFTLSQIQAIAEKFNVTIDYLLKGTHNEKDGKQISKSTENKIGKITESAVSVGNIDTVQTTITKSGTKELNAEKPKCFNGNNSFSADFLNRIDKLCCFSGTTIEAIVDSENNNIKQQDIEKVKKGNVPTSKLVEEFSNVLSCPIDYLLYGKFPRKGEYAENLFKIMEKFDISYAQFLSFSGLTGNILNAIGGGALPFGRLRYRISNTIENLTANRATISVDIQSEKNNYEFFICEKQTALDYIEMLNLNKEQQQ